MFFCKESTSVSHTIDVSRVQQAPMAVRWVRDREILAFDSGYVHNALSLGPFFLIAEGIRGSQLSGIVCSLCPVLVIFCLTLWLLLVVL